MNYKILSIKTVSTDDMGSLSFFEAQRDIPFEIKRIYYISGVPEKKKRGFHAHKELKQLLFCPYGIIKITLDDTKSRTEIILDDPSKGILIEEPLWREMEWVVDGSVLCVAASDYYEVEDYIRDYNEFVKYIRNGEKK